MPTLVTNLNMPIRVSYPNSTPYHEYILIITKTLQTEFEFLFQNLHRKTLYMLSRKGSFLHQEPNKIRFAFF
jgi:hypothetical protein